MTQRKALKALAAIVLFSTLLLVFNYFYKKIKPEAYLEAKRENPVELAMARRDLMDDLPIQENDPKTAVKNDRGLLAWSQESIIPEFHKADLNIYRGRNKNAHALEGIVLFIDAGEVEDDILIDDVPSGEQTRKANVAATDPFTGLPVRQKSGVSQVEKEKEKEKVVAPGEILDTLAKKLKKEMEDMGATVYLTREQSKSGSEISQQAVIGNQIAQRFLAELKEQNFKSVGVETLIPTLHNTVTDPGSLAARALFTNNGINSNLRLLLDVERQYKEAFFLSLRLGDSETESGVKVLYYGATVGASFGASALDEANPQNQPAYVAYDVSSRRRLAEQVERNIREYLPELSYKGKQTAVQESAVVSGRYNNLTAVELVIAQRANEENVRFLQQESNIKTLAEAIALSAYEFYCDQP